MPNKIKSIAEQIAAHIHAAIFAGKILPGERLKENDISEWLGVSRTPTREAFRILESQGLIEINPNKGVQVSLITREDLAELFELRQVLELHCLRKFVKTANETDIQDLEVLIQNMEKALAANDTLSYLRYSVDFHLHYIAKCQNKRLISIFSVLKDNIRCAQIFFMKKWVTRKESVEEHRAILKALKDRDAGRSETLLRKHLNNSYERMLKFIDRDNPETRLNIASKI
jgi:DNA-binding GntR family transcriptional regulator